MHEKYFYATGNKQFGPVTLEELQALALQGKFTPSDRYWKSGMEKWGPAANLIEIFDELPPPLETTSILGQQAEASIYQECAQAPLEQRSPKDKQICPLTGPLPQQITGDAMTHERGADLLFRRFVVGIFVIILGFLIFLLFTSKGWEGQAKPNESASSTDPAGGNSSFGLEDRLAGQWYSVTGPRMSLTFEKGGGLKLVLYATGGVSFDMNSSGSYTVTGSRAFTILEGGEYSDGRLEGDELAITKRGDLTSRFRKN